MFPFTQPLPMLLSQCECPAVTQEVLVHGIHSLVLRRYLAVCASSSFMAQQWLCLDIMGVEAWAELSSLWWPSLALDGQSSQRGARKRLCDSWTLGSPNVSPSFNYSHTAAGV